MQRWEITRAENDAALEDIIRDYAPLFPNPKRPNVSLPIGWMPILRKVCEGLAGFKNNKPPIQILQVKDKFCSLRIYGNFPDSFTPTMLAAEEEAERTCMVCSADVSIYESSKASERMNQVLCEKCRLEDGKND